MQRVAESLGKRPRTIYYAMQFAKKYPDLNLLPEGKATSWHHIINKYLTDGTEKKVVKRADLCRMIKEIKELLVTEYLKSGQQEAGFNDMANTEYSCLGDFIHYLQDQIEKILANNK